MRDINKYNKCLCTDCGINCDLFEHEETNELVCRGCLEDSQDEENEDEEE